MPIVCAALVGCSDEIVDPVCDPPATCLREFPGLTAPVRLLRDPLGVVHVYGDTDADVFYGSGYAQAVDRLFQMDLVRRRALGRRAEVLGLDFVDDDVLVRTLDIPRWGRANAELTKTSRPDVHALVAAWTAGVNARIGEVTSGAAPMPHGFGAAELDYSPEPWSSDDAYIVGKMILFGNANLIEYEILATLLRDYFPDVAALPIHAPLTDAFVLPPEERPLAGNHPLSGPWPDDLRPPSPLPPDAADRIAAFTRSLEDFRPGGSNNWAIDGVHTDTGRPIIAGDPHQPLRSPSVMWAHHMNSADAGGSVDVIGFSFVGGPGVQLGHNAHVAWTATTTYPDTMDLWDVPIVDGVAHVGDLTMRVEVRTEEIAVRGGEPQRIEIVEVPGHGVVLPEGLSPLPVVSPGNSLLFNWTGFAPTHDAVGFFGIALARDLDQVEAAVDLMEIGNFNFIAATAEGISYRASPLVPDRGAPVATLAPYAVLDGTDPATLWTGEHLPLEVLPHSRGGDRRWLASANNDPYGFTADGRLDGDAFYYGVFFDPGTRAARIEDEIARLVAAGPVTVADARALQLDTHSLLADRIVPILEQVHATVDTDETLADFRGRRDLSDLVATIAGWDRRMIRASAAALAYHAFMWFVVRRTIADELGLAFGPIADASPIYAIKFGLQPLLASFAQSDAFLQEGRARTVMLALDDTAAFLVERFGASQANAYAWADFHQTRFESLWGDALDGGSVPTDGADGTVNVSAATFFDGAGVVPMISSGDGPIYRMVAAFDEAGVPSASVTFPRGNSGEPGSPHFADTLDDWVQGEYQPLWFTRSDVAERAVEEIVLLP